MESNNSNRLFLLLSNFFNSEEEAHQIFQTLEKNEITTVDKLFSTSSEKLKELFPEIDILGSLKTESFGPEDGGRISEKVINNELYIGDINTKDIVSKFGSPLYVYDEDIIRSRIHALKNNIHFEDVYFYYACKANTNIRIMEIFKQEGCRIDATSPGEIFLAQKAGFTSEEIMFTGNNSTKQDFQFAIQRNILVNLGSLSQIKKYGTMDPGKDICIRINTNIVAGRVLQISTAGPHTKFGIMPNQLLEAIKIAEQYNLNIIGIHSHLGSGILDTEKIICGIKALLSFTELFKNLQFVDFGGGFGVPYLPTESFINMKILGIRISEIFEDFSLKIGKKMKFYFEPGRYFMAESGTLLATITDIKINEFHNFAGLDSGAYHLIGPVLFESYYPMINASNVVDTGIPYLVVGNACYSGDQLTPTDREISTLHEGDILAIKNAGSYCFSFSSHQTSRLLTGEVLISKGTEKLIRKAESLEDLLINMV